MSRISPSLLKDALEGIYHKWNHPQYIHPDPLEFVHRFSNPIDQEIVGLLASCLAYGRVQQILNSVELLLERLGEPAKTITGSSRSDIELRLSGFKHRFTSGKEIASLLSNVAEIIEHFGSIGDFFYSLCKKSDDDLVPALSRFVKRLTKGEDGLKFLLPDPERGSACKRPFLYLRWMVRDDGVDLGLWDKVEKSKLIIPLDTHMLRIGRELGWVKNKQGNLQAAVKITQGFKSIAPDDPVKYDFALTRWGIRDDTSGTLAQFLGVE